MRPTPRPHGLMFHHFADATHPRGQGAIDAQQLRSILVSAGLHRFLTPAQWTARALDNELSPTDLCLTFDDCLLCQFDVAVPVLQELGLRGFFFVYSSVLEGNVERLEAYRYFRTTAYPSVDAFYADFFAACPPDVSAALDSFNPATYLAGFPFYTDNDRRFRYLRDDVLGPTRYDAVMDSLLARAGVTLASLAPRLWMADEHLRQLHAAGHAIGLHSHTHPTRLERLAPRDQATEYARNAAYLTALLGQRPTSMSHPCNSYTPGTLSLLRDLGIHIGFRANMTAGTFGPLELPREDHANLLAALNPPTARAA